MSAEASDKSMLKALSMSQIYRDYADNGRLDGTYSRADLDRALKDAVLQGYGNQNVQPALQQQLSLGGHEHVW